MMQNPIVTVVTVTYNSANYVREAIESVLHSSLTDFELILGDDCSKDKTWDIIQSYQDTRIVAYRNDKNMGEYSNRNKAIALARGKYLIFIDGDDMIYPHGLEFMVKMLEAFPQCAMALMRWFKNNLFYPVIVSPNQFYIGEYFGNGFLGTAFSNVLFNTKILKEEGGLSVKYRAGDDFIRYKIAAKYPSLLINDNLTWWRETPGQASQKIGNDFEGEEMKLEFLHSSECPLDLQDRTLAEESIYRSLIKSSMRELFKLRGLNAIKIFSKFRLPFYLVFSFYKKPIVVDPFKTFSAANPNRLEFSQNPYSR